MKTLKIYIAHEISRVGDDNNSYYWTEDEAIGVVSNIHAHLTQRERQNITLYVDGYTVRVPDDYTETTAKQLFRDLLYGDVESPDFDDLCCGFSSKEIFCREYNGD